MGGTWRYYRWTGKKWILMGVYVSHDSYMFIEWPDQHDETYIRTYEPADDVPANQVYHMDVGSLDNTLGPGPSLQGNWADWIGKP